MAPPGEVGKAAKLPLLLPAPALTLGCMRPLLLGKGEMGPAPPKAADCAARFWAGICWGEGTPNAANRTEGEGRNTERQ